MIDRAFGQDLVGDQVVALVEVQHPKLLPRLEADCSREIVQDELPSVEARPLHQEPLGHNAANRAEQVEQVIVVQLLRHCRTRLGKPQNRLYAAFGPPVDKDALLDDAPAMSSCSLAIGTASCSMTLTTVAICSVVIHHRSPSGQQATTLNLKVLVQADGQMSSLPSASARRARAKLSRSASG